jgi:DNA-binding IclR family transcriptional regulator
VSTPASEAVKGDHRTASRVLDILEVLAGRTASYSLRDLSQELSAPKSSLIPLLRTLLGRGYISQDRSGEYSLGTRILELSARLDQQSDMRKIAHRELLALRNQTGESVILSRLTSDRHSVVFIDTVDSHHRVHASAQVGETHPLHSSSSGRLLLAYMPVAERDAIIDTLQLTPLTRKTITSRKALRDELERIQSSAVCITVDQTILGRCAIAAPIFNHWGEVIAACVLNAPTERVQDAIPALTEAVTACAASISLQIGYRGEHGNQQTA